MFLSPADVETLTHRKRWKAGIGDARFHDLRRKAGTELDLAAAQALLGHTDSRITRRHYHHKRTARAAR